MSKKLIYLLLALSIGLNIGVIGTTVVHRGKRLPPPRPPGPPTGGQHQPGQRPDPARIVEDHVRGMTQHLNLNSEQQQAIRAILERYATQLTALQVEVEETSQRLPEAYADPAIDPDQFQQLVAEASNARAQLDSLSAVMLMAEAAVLTPEQRQKFAEVAPSIHSRPKRPRGQGGPPPR